MCHAISPSNYYYYFVYLLAACSSIELVKSSQKTIYFVNMNDLLTVVKESKSSMDTLAFDEIALRRVEHRFRYLDGLFRPASSEPLATHQVMVYLSRIHPEARMNWDKYVILIEPTRD